jgi:hypothetical protein
MRHTAEGDFIVIDQSGVNAGLMGSENTLTALKRGVRGFVSNGGVRDTDEVILQQVPFWSRMVSQGMVQSRNRKVRLQTLRAGPSDYAATPQVENRGQVEPSFIGLEIGDIGHPDLIWTARGPAGGQPIARSGTAMTTVGSPRTTTMFLAAADPTGPH